MADDIELADAIKATHEEIEAAREVVRNLANELADVIDVIEPALTSHTKRLRQARMSSLDEMRQVTNAIRELKTLLLADTTEQMFARAERFLDICRALDYWRTSGYLDVLARAFQTIHSTADGDHRPA
jgi:negative regulator of replication initiation